jgi:hypothetical protein
MVPKQKTYALNIRTCLAAVNIGIDLAIGDLGDESSTALSLDLFTPFIF